MMKVFVGLASIFGVTVVSVAAASAAIIDVVATGHVNFANDRAGLFGPADVRNPYVGAPVALRIRFDNTLGVPAASVFPPSYTSVTGIVGGSEPGFGGATSPAIAATFALNNVDVDVGFSGLAQLTNVTDANGRFFAATAQEPTPIALGATGQFVAVTVSDMSLLIDLNGPASYTFSGDNPNLSITYQLYGGNNGLGVRPLTNVFAYLDTLTITPQVQAVPEPSTWAMMILGFSGLCLVAYRRRQSTSLELESVH